MHHFSFRATRLAIAFATLAASRFMGLPSLCNMYYCIPQGAGHAAAECAIATSATAENSHFILFNSGLHNRKQEA